MAEIIIPTEIPPTNQRYLFPDEELSVLLEVFLELMPNSWEVSSFLPRLLKLFLIS